LHKNLNELYVHIFLKIEYGNGVELSYIQGSMVYVLQIWW